MTKSQLLILSALNASDGPRFVYEFEEAELDARQLPALVGRGWAAPTLYEPGLAYRITKAGIEALRNERWRLLTPWWRRAWRWVFMLLAISACADQPVPTPPPAVAVLAVIEPRCSVATAHVGSEMQATITGVCNSQAHLRGGVATADNQSLLFINEPVPCPFVLVRRFIDSGDWQYVIHLEDGKRPGVTSCEVEP